MPSQQRGPTLSRQHFLITVGSALGLAATGALFKEWSEHAHPPRLRYHARVGVDAGGYGLVMASLQRWPENASLAQIGNAFIDARDRVLASAEKKLARTDLLDFRRIQVLFAKAAMLNYEGKPRE